MKPTRKNYEKYLNEVGMNLEREAFIIGGKFRRCNYGTAIRKYDVVMFNVGFNEFRQLLCNNEI